mmetsp:Transcript_29510/g.45298  ORF Transcript_29510/g.45298 Transcript_29510/m.45298 type:complete len:123 (+) Transcript_29510:114-482(+)
MYFELLGCCFFAVEFFQGELRSFDDLALTPGVKANGSGDATTGVAVEEELASETEKDVFLGVVGPWLLAALKKDWFGVDAPPDEDPKDKSTPNPELSVGFDSRPGFSPCTDSRRAIDRVRSC